MGKCFSAQCTSSARLDGKTVLITGANTGIGKCAAQDFYLKGAHVILACRSLEKAEAAVSEIKKNCEGELLLGSLNKIELDLNSLESVRKCANKILVENRHINILLNNAGVMACPENRTKDGLVSQISTNHLGPFLFTLLLLPKIIKSAPARIINVSSIGHKLLDGLNLIDMDDINWEKRAYDLRISYAESKLANILFAKELARRLEEAKITGVTTYSLHPGLIATELGRHLDTAFSPALKWININIFDKILWKTPEQGAQTSIHCAVDENAEKETGLYYAECKVTEPSANAKNVEMAKKLWEDSCKFVGLEDYDPFKQ